MKHAVFVHVDRRKLNFNFFIARVRKHFKVGKLTLIPGNIDIMFFFKLGQRRFGAQKNCPKNLMS